MPGAPAYTNPIQAREVPGYDGYMNDGQINDIVSALEKGGLVVERDQESIDSNKTLPTRQRVPREVSSERSDFFNLNFETMPGSPLVLYKKSEVISGYKDGKKKVEGLKKIISDSLPKSGD